MPEICDREKGTECSGGSQVHRCLEQERAPLMAWPAEAWREATTTSAHTRPRGKCVPQSERAWCAGHTRSPRTAHRSPKGQRLPSPPWSRLGPSPSGPGWVRSHLALHPLCQLQKGSADINPPSSEESQPRAAKPLLSQVTQGSGDSSPPAPLGPSAHPAAAPRSSGGGHHAARSTRPW